MQKSLYLFLLLFFCSCSSPHSEAIEDALRQAGKNRKELEKVLKHYSADSLKLRAAEFLIVNMPGKYSEYYNAPWNDAATVFLRWTSSSNKRMVIDEYNLGKLVVEDDLTHITAAYIINNIDLAFKVWQETPWGKDIPFDVFCETILPYRLDTEPLENWRKKALASFADPYKSFLNDSAITSVDACIRINDLLPRFRVDSDFPPMNFSQLMASARGTCDAMAAIAIFSMRALGIPVTLDYTPRWPNMNVGHSWNSVYDNAAGNYVSFMGADFNPGIPHSGKYSVKYKAFRYTFGRQNINLNERDIPPMIALM